eukprot:SAG11_NODE_244_length_11735_cov_13.768900_8_plen_121_part_00
MLPVGGVVLLNQQLYTKQQWGSAQTGYGPFRGISVKPQPTAPMLLPDNIATPDQVSATAEQAAAERDEGRPLLRMTYNGRCLREIHFLSRDENYIYCLEIVENEVRKFVFADCRVASSLF